MIKLYRYFWLLILVIIVGACDGGLKPIEKSKITGTITYVNGKEGWPPADSIKDLRVVAFKKYPPGDILSEIEKKNVLFSNNTLPYFVDSSSYVLELDDAPQTYEYIVVAQNYGSLLEWRAIGVYTLSGDKSKPSPVSVGIEKTKRNINIEVDFKNLPPQPF